jgi:hypothetical protein
MGFFSSLFGGPSAQQQQLAANESNLATQMSQAFQSQLSDQKGVMDRLNQQLTPIANLGPNQQGYSPQELAAMNSQAINNAGAASRNAQQMVGNTLAGQGGGGSSGLVSGIQQQIRGTIASAGANQLANAQNLITEQNYATGRQNFESAVSGEHALAGLYNPEQFGNLASGTNQQALQDANQITQEKQAAAFAPLALGAKLIGGGLTGAMGGFGSLGMGDPALSGVPQSFGDKIGNFFGGAETALSGQG